MKKPNILMDALKLFLITLVAGALLGGVYYITKEPIAAMEEKTKNEAYQAVLPQASEFKPVFEKNLSQSADEKGVSITASLEGFDNDGLSVGYVITSTSSKSYGGDITIVMGFDLECKITGVCVLSINDTPGLGMKAKEAGFKDQYVGKSANIYTITKTGASNDTEIDAISSATITSNAFNDAVNGAVNFLKEGLANE